MILLIGGTSETAPLATGLAEAGYDVLVSTATDAPLATGDHPRISRRTGSLDEAGITALAKERGIRAIVDAAHPYAEAVHAAARNAAKNRGIPCLMLQRPEALSPEGSPDRISSTKWLAAQCVSIDAEGVSIRFASNHGDAAGKAFGDGRPVLLTTGSRNLVPYAEASSRTGIPLAVRVLDIPDSFIACREAGIPEERIIAGRGPFSVSENLAAIRRFGTGVVVTKESGSAGGFEAKVAAAAQAGCLLVVMRRPETIDSPFAFDIAAPLISTLAALIPS